MSWMNRNRRCRRQRRLLLLACLCPLYCGSSALLAQAPPAPAPTPPATTPPAAAGTDNIPEPIKTAPNPTIITAFINTQVAKLGGEDPEARRAGREKLVTEASSAGSPPASPDYQRIYATTLNGALTPVLSSPNVAARLNAAIAVARIAEKTSSAALAPAVTTLLADKSEAVRLWALRAAKFVLPAVLQTNAASGNTLINAIVTAGKSDPGGMLMSDAYEALSLNFTDSAKYTPAQWTTMVGATVPVLLKTASERAEMYKTGIPPTPAAEKPALTILTTNSIWRVETVAQQVQTVQLLSDLLSLAANRATALQGPDREQVLLLVQHVGRVIWVAGANVNDNNVKAITPPITTIGANTTNDKILAAVAPVYPALIKVKGWEKLTPPPSLGEGTAAPAPATGGAKPTTTQKAPGA